MKYIGIADCNGLESFVSITLDSAIAKLKNEEYKNPLGLLAIRAQANAHRFAVVFRAEIESEEAEKIKKLFNEGKYEEALVELKSGVDEIELAKTGINAEKAWKMIPNKDLNPFS